MIPNFETIHSIGDFVYTKTGTKDKYIITGILVAPHDFTYQCTCGERLSYFYEMEITDEKDWEE